MRMLTFAAALLALSTAFLLYAVNYDARRLEAELQRRERTADKLRGDIAILKAERAHLARPVRIELLARAQGLHPLTARQIAEGEDAVQPSASAATRSQ